MAQDLNQAMDRLQEMLSTEDGKQNLQDLMGAFGGIGGDGGSSNSPQTNMPSSGMNLDMLTRIKGIMDEMQSGNDPRTNLLYALKPYLSQNRLGHIDNAVKLMSLGKLPALLKHMRS